MTPGTQPQRVNKKTITTEPQPFPKTDKGGKNIANKTRNKLIVIWLINVLMRRASSKNVTKNPANSGIFNIYQFV